jgi:anti-sigma B factor antagonist
MVVTVERSDDAPVRASTIVLEGDIDLTNIASVAATIDAELHAGVERITVDLDRVTFMNSSLLNVLVAARQRCAAAGGELGVTSSVASHRRLFTITNLDRLLIST